MPGLDSLPPEIRSLRPVRTLEANLQKGRLAHAILLKGDDMGMLESVSHALARTLLGGKMPPSQHPDFFTLRPEGRARDIKVGDRNKDVPNTMRFLTRQLNQTSNQGGYKVAVVYEADRMNDKAANAFLKTLEEPPPRTIILLLSTRPYELMETIRSRCFHFRIPSRSGSGGLPDWDMWLDDYRSWITWLHKQPAEARRSPDIAILRIYALITRFVGILETLSITAWDQRESQLPESISDEEIDALKVGIRKGIRDKLLIDIEENTRLAAIEMSHTVPFPADLLARSISSLESITGLLALNMKDDAALESFFLKSLKIWT